jgi:hypothetical protein
VYLFSIVKLQLLIREKSAKHHNSYILNIVSVDLFPLLWKIMSFILFLFLAASFHSLLSLPNIMFLEPVVILTFLFFIMMFLV